MSDRPRVKKTIHCYEINGTYHLLPIGQGIMDHEKGLATNEVGKLIWETLASGGDREEALRVLMREYEATEEDRPILEADVNAFLGTLQQHGFFESAWHEPENGTPARKVKIGPLTMELRIPDALFERYYVSFSTLADAPSAAQPDTIPSVTARTSATTGADQTVTFCAHHPLTKQNGQVLVRNEEVLIMETEDSFVILPLLGRYVYEISCAKDGREAFVYGTNDGTSPCMEELFSALRFPFLILAQARGLCVMHSASLLYQGKAWLFSGHSGAGKSTHVQLWQDTFGTPWINGDLNLLGIKEGQAVCYGLPWCGTSGISTPGEFPLGGITFLTQAPYDKVSGLASDALALSLAKRMITPNWTASMMQQNIDAAISLSSLIHGFRLECTKDPNAARVMKSAIDQI
ncbi:MAG: PqqD family protein [Lachnospiraceae bacterium]|nr:PqqD family protein [Lachnospiraceae bacterium]